MSYKGAVVYWIIKKYVVSNILDVCNDVNLSKQWMMLQSVTNVNNYNDQLVVVNHQTLFEYKKMHVLRLQDLESKLSSDRKYSILKRNLVLIRFQFNALTNIYVHRNLVLFWQ